MDSKKKADVRRKASVEAKPVTNSGSVYLNLLQFLKSPMWALPVMSFIEQRSLAFDKEQEEERLYKQIHNEFKAMVDMLMQCFCDDIGVRPQEVAEAIKTDKSKERSKLEQSILEPIIAAHEYNVFVHMMMRKNIELQLQALQMIEIVYGLIPAVLLPGGPGGTGQPQADDQERLILIEVINRSKEDYERDQKRRGKVTKDEERAIQLSLEEKERLQREHLQEDELVRQALGLSLNDPSHAKVTRRASSSTRRKSAAAAENDTTQSKSRTNVNDVRASGDNVRPATSKPAPARQTSLDTAGPGRTSSDIRALLQEKEGISEEELKKRKEYLRQQRDKLLNMKREARERAFAESEGEGKNSRPKTARAAKSALRGRGEIPKVSDEVIAARRALVEKLKSEVVGH